MQDGKTALRILTAALNEALRIVEAQLDAGLAAQAELAELKQQLEAEHGHVE